MWNLRKSLVKFFEISKNLKSLKNKLKKLSVCRTLFPHWNDCHLCCLLRWRIQRGIVISKYPLNMLFSRSFIFYRFSIEKKSLETKCCPFHVLHRCIQFSDLWVQYYKTVSEVGRSPLSRLIANIHHQTWPWKLRSWIKHWKLGLC